LVFTTARGRDAVFWQSPRTRKQARPGVRTPTARAAGIPDLQIVIDSHEQYPYRFATQQGSTVKRALPCGDYGLVLDGALVASGGRKSMVDRVAGRRRQAALPGRRARRPAPGRAGGRGPLLTAVQTRPRPC